MSQPSKQQFALKLNPCRPSFAFDMNDEEKTIMQEHVVYLTNLMKKGVVKVFGPVMNPAAPYGFAIVEADNEGQVKGIIANDPASRINTYEYYPMMATFPQQ
ncbi:MAG: YciI family protein [Bacteroidota bacterium]